jgi:hypothetical protein
MVSPIGWTGMNHWFTVGLLGIIAGRNKRESDDGKSMGKKISDCYHSVPHSVPIHASDFPPLLHRVLRKRFSDSCLSSLC